VFGLGICGLSLAGGYAAFLAVLIILYAAGGLYDVGINASAVDLERATSRRFMALLHAAFSGGAAVGALSAGVLLQAGVDYRLVYLGVLLPLIALVIAFATVRFPGPERTVDGEKTGVLAHYRHMPLMLVAMIATLGLLAEGEMEHWSGVYLRQTLELPALLGGAGVAVFYGAMAAGRLAAAGTISRFGNRRSLIGAGLLTMGGMALALATREPVVIVGGFLLVGLALSAVVPIAFSLAGDLAPGRAGAAISAVTTLGYGGFLVGPVIVGGLAEVLGLRLALLTIAVAGFFILMLSLRVKPSRAS
jgi:MFS family permease